MTITTTTTTPTTTTATATTTTTAESRAEPDPKPAFRIDDAAWADDCEILYALRRQVFVDEQGIAPALEQDGRDDGCQHVLARAADDTPIGTGRLLPDGQLGRVAVLAHWRGRGVGRALTVRLIELARARGDEQVLLHAQRDAEPFYLKLGFRAVGEAFVEAGIAHREMRLQLADWRPDDDGGDVDADRARELDGVADSLDAGARLIAGARRRLSLYTPFVHPGLYGAAALNDALRAKLAEQPRLQARLLLPPAAGWRRRCPLLAAQIQRRGAVELRHWPDDEPRDRAEFALGFWIADEQALLLHDDPRGASGRYTPSGGPFGRGLLNFFDASWERAAADRELRAL